MVDKIVISTSVCIRCGKTRIVTESYQEKLGNGAVTFTQTSCPDLECQKKLDLQLLLEREKRMQNSSSKSSRFTFKK